MDDKVNNYWFVIPARKGSKRFPLKNRKLVPLTLTQLDKQWIEKTIITTNDSYIVEIGKSQGAHVHNRSEKNSSDNASMKDTLKEVISDFNIPKNDILICLYPTYPQRTIKNIVLAIDFFKKSGANSMLCKKDIKSHPYLCMRDMGDNKGSLFIESNLYRWQDYPKCFQYSHFITIFKIDEIDNLNYQLFNKDTVYYNISDVFDVDTVSDFNNYLISKEKKK